MGPNKERHTSGQTVELFSGMDVFPFKKMEGRQRLIGLSCHSGPENTDVEHFAQLFKCNGICPTTFQTFNLQDMEKVNLGTCIFQSVILLPQKEKCGICS